MKIGPCAARWAVGLTLGALLCLITSSRAQSTDGECAALGAVNEFAVRTSSDAAALDVLVYSCPGEVFEVTWEGRVGLLSPIAIHNGTSLSITGVVGSSSSAQLGGGGSHAVIEAVEGSSTRYPSFYVLSESTLTLSNLVLENDPYDPADYGGSIYAYTNATESPVSPATVNVNGCTFQNNTASLGELAGAVYLQGENLRNTQPLA